MKSTLMGMPSLFCLASTVPAAGQDDVVALIKANPKHTTVLGKLGPDDVTAVAGYVKQMAGGK